MTKITGTLTLDTGGNGIYEATVERDDDNFQDAAYELEERIANMLAEEDV